MIDKIKTSRPRLSTEHIPCGVIVAVFRVSLQFTLMPLHTWRHDFRAEPHRPCPCDAGCAHDAAHRSGECRGRVEFTKVCKSMSPPPGNRDDPQMTSVPVVTGFDLAFYFEQYFCYF